MPPVLFCRRAVHRLRRIGYRDPESGNRREFMTNHFRIISKTIAGLYKEGRQIEIVFREMTRCSVFAG
ncbi:MAG: hypothetical protein LBD42_01340 [Desulfovibrio sp.]|jgi:hypothetical protein|nr:hypothetical protein [Desulfovibrio sp.]